jgi:16S rRNA processing protein RimM
MAFFLNMKNQTLKKIGFFSRVHGFKGKLVLSIPPDSINLVNQNKSIWIDLNGIKSPYKIINLQPLKKGKLVLDLLNVNQEKAEILVNCKVYIDANAIKIKNSPLDKGNHIIDYKIYDQNDKYIGIVSDHIEIKNNELIQTFVNNQEVLIPFKKENTIEVNHTKRFVKANIPEGLLNIYLE